MFCRNCGTQLSDEAKFCTNCGAPVSGTPSGSGNSAQTELEQKQPNQPATGTSIVVEPGALEGAVREAQAGAILHLKTGEHRLSHPLELSKPLSLIGEGMGNTRVLCDGEAHVIKLVGDGPFVLHDLSFEHLGSLWANVVEVAGGEINIRRCRFSGGVGVVGEMKTGAGLFLRNQTRGLVANCEPVRNERIGILVGDQAQPTLEANSCQGNRVSGILVGDQAQPTLETNTCQGNGEGIGYTASAAGTARHNTCRANDHGISIIGQAKPVLEDNTVSDNEENGIIVGSVAHPTLEANTCQNNKLMGIGYADDAAGTARHNVCSANGSGIGVVERAHPTLEANTCQENLQYGLIYIDNAAGVARNNAFSLNEPDDLYVESSAHPMLQENYSTTLHPRGEQTPREEESSRQPWRYWPTEKGCLFYLFWGLILFWVLSISIGILIRFFAS
jgi:parallel beta-helix repeat protein